MLITLLLAAHTLDTAQPQAAIVDEDDRRALVELAQTTDRAWDERDAGQMAASYRPDAVLKIGLTEPEVRGRESIRIHFEKAFAGRTGRLRHVTELTGLEAIGPDQALSEGEVRVEAEIAPDRWRAVRRFRTTSFAIRESGRWQLRWVRALALPENVK